ncbi:MAG: FtsK/SpoIIIE domain-containing protein, partial [Tepidisphaeraceae bacterium]
MSIANSIPTPDTAKPSAAPAPETDRDLQRGALGDLVRLATDVAKTETEIEQQHRAAGGSAEKQATAKLEEVEARFTAERQQIDASHAREVGQADASCRSDLNTLTAAHRAARQRADREKASVEEKVKGQYDHAAWLAESVFDGTNNQTETEARKSRESIQADLEQLFEQEKQGKALLQKYRVRPPADTGGAGDAPPEAIEQIKANPEAALTAARDGAGMNVSRLRGLAMPTLFVGAWPVVVLILVLLVAAFVSQVVTGAMPPKFTPGGTPILAWKALGIWCGAAVVAALGVGFLLKMLSTRQALAAYAPIQAALAQARAALKRKGEVVEEVRLDKLSRAAKKREHETRRAREQSAPALTDAQKKHLGAVAAADAEFAKAKADLTARRDATRRAADESHAKTLADYDRRHAAELSTTQAAAEQARNANKKIHRDRRAQLQTRWDGGLSRIESGIASQTDGATATWDDPAWNDWQPPKAFPATVRFGQLRVDLKKVVEHVAGEGKFTLQLPETFTVPALLAFPKQSSLLIHFDRDSRTEAIRTLQMVMVRLLTTIPPGRLRFTIIDPVGLGQNFAGFMHLADYDESLVGSRIWTDAEQIDRRLTDLTEHMETVIQKYLRNEFATIDDYNAQAGELAEPYRFLVISDLPVNFSDESMRRLASIALTGWRCGVYTLVARDTRAQLPSGTHIDELVANSVNLLRERGEGESGGAIARWVWKDDVFRQFPLTLDGPPGEQFLTDTMHVVGRGAKDANRVEVPFDSIAPTGPEQFWSMDSSDDLRVPIGRMGATRLQSLRLGRGVAQHALIAGKTGSGKSTLLHAIVTNVAMWYSPDQVELYLVDFKKGVEFKTYATHALPHARAIAVESDREFGLSVLQRIDAELTRRGELFRKAGVQDLASYRKSSDARTLPRTLLIIDEFQEFFSEDDKLGQEAAMLLDRLVRQGRAFGIHVLLGSQTIGGSSGLSRSTLGQMAVRIALQTSEADSHLILGDNNAAARLLSRPGEAIYNDAGGLVEANSPFQIAWLPDERRDVYLSRVSALARGDGNGRTRHGAPPVVFEGNAPAQITKNARLAALLESKPASAPASPIVFLGEPVAIKEATAVTFRRQTGANVLVVGQQEELALAMTASAMISLAAQHPKGSAVFHVLDGSAADSSLAGVLPRVTEAIAPHDVKLVEYRVVPESIDEIAKEVARRQAADDTGAGLPSIYVFVYGLQRYRALRKQEESFRFSSDDGEKPPQPDKQFADILREGPAVGVHVMAWADTPVAVERTLDRGSLREFDNRVLFQMSATDSSNLIDSPVANKLGFFRALAYSEERGTMEKFRPYGPPEKAWLEQVKA